MGLSHQSFVIHFDQYIHHSWDEVHVNDGLYLTLLSSSDVGDSPCRFLEHKYRTLSLSLSLLHTHTHTHTK